MEDKIKVTDLDIIVTMIDNEPYYEIKYKEVGSKDYKIGYSSYRLRIVLEYKERYFDIVKEECKCEDSEQKEDEETVMRWMY